MKKIREVNDQYKEFADPNEKLHKHKTSYSGKRTAFFAKGITIASAAVLTFSAVTGSNQSLISTIKPPAVTQNGTDPSSPSLDPQQNENVITQTVLVDPTIDSLSGIYHYESETTTIYFVISPMDADSIDSAVVRINGRSYSASVGSQGEVTIQGRLKPGSYDAVLDVEYTIKEEKKNMSSSTVVTVNPYVEPVIKSASASYDKASDTVSIFASVEANDAIIINTRATLSGYWFGIGIGSGGGSGSVNGINFFTNGTHSGYVTVTYTINGAEKSISAPLSVVIDKEEPIVIPKPEKEPEPEPTPTPPADEPTDPEEMESNINAEEYEQIENGFVFSSSGAYLNYTYEAVITDFGIDPDNDSDKFSLAVTIANADTGESAESNGFLYPADLEVMADGEEIYVRCYDCCPEIPLPPPTESGEVEYIVTTTLIYQDDEKIIRFMPVSEFSQTVKYNFDGPTP